MTASVKVSGTWKAGNYYVKVAGAWKACAVYAKVSGVWKLIASHLSATLSPTSISQSVANGSVTLFNSCTTTADGAIGTPTYAWERTGGDTRIVATNPTSATTSFNSTGTNEIVAASFKCVVTDDVGSVDTSNTVSVQATHGSPP